MNANEIRDRILPVVIEIYGDSSMTLALVEDLSAKITKWTDDRYRTREDMIFQTCWNWFSGGSTAEYAAREIEAVL